MTILSCSRRSFLRQSSMAGWAAACAAPVLGQPNRKGKVLSSLGVVVPVDQCLLVEQCGYDFWEGTVGQFLVPDKPEDVFQANLEKMRQSKLPVPAVNVFLPGNLKVVGPEANEEAVLKRAETTFPRMKQAGTGILVFGSGGARRVPDGFDKDEAKNQFVRLNRKLGSLAERFGVTIVLEPLNYGETNLMNTVEEGLAMAIEVNHPQVKLLVDIFHMLRNNEPPESILKAKDWIRHAHIAEKEKRTPPGTAGDDFRPYLAALKKIGYTGALAIEASQWGEKEKAMQAALPALKKQIAEA